MVAENRPPRTIDKPKLLLVEGKDEELFFCFYDQEDGVYVRN